MNPIVLLFLLPLAFGQIPDYDNPYAPIFFDKPVYTWTDKVKITIIAPSWNSNDNLIDSIGDDSYNPIKISVGPKSLEPYRLTESGANSGIFTGEIILSGFSHDADGDGDIDTSPRTFGNGPTGGFLESERDSAITVSFEFADGVVLTESAPIRWNLGTISFSKTEYLLNESITITVIDRDMNRNPESLDHIPLDVYSDSDSGGLSVDAIETSDESGRFEASIILTQSQSSSGNRLHAKQGDAIHARYSDHTLPSPYSISDSIEISASASIESHILPTERLTMDDLFFADSMGNQIISISSNNQVQIVGTVSNLQDIAQDFVYLIQVKDKDDMVVSLSWIVGQLSPIQSLDVSQSWAPPSPGDYTIEAFVWQSLQNPIALSKQLERPIHVD